MKKILTFFFSLLICSILFAEKTFYDEIVEHYEKIVTFQAELIQENYWNEIDVKKESKGMLYYNQDSLRITYTSPDDQHLFVLKNDILLYEEKKAQAIWLDKGDYNIKPVEIMQHYMKMSEPEIVSISENITQIHLFNDLENIEIKVDNMFIRTVKIEDNEGNFVYYRFQNELINPVLPENIFLPHLPEETNIIDNRGN